MRSALYDEGAQLDGGWEGLGTRAVQAEEERRGEERRREPKRGKQDGDHSALLWLTV